MGTYQLPAYKRTTHVNGDYQKSLLFPRYENNFKITAFFVAAVLHIYSPVTAQHQTLLIGQSAHFHCDNYFVLGGICTSLRVSSIPISREFLRFLATKFVACSKPRAEIIIVKLPIQGRNNVTRVWVEPTLCN